jgi:hypothetical protein
MHLLQLQLEFMNALKKLNFNKYLTIQLKNEKKPVYWKNGWCLFSEPVSGDSLLSPASELSENEDQKECSSRFKLN